MNDVFLDTVGLLAVWDTSDQWHAAADTAYRILLEEGRRLVTTPLILWECGNAASRRPYRPRVNVLRQSLIGERLLIEPAADEIEEAWAAFANNSRRATVSTSLGWIAADTSRIPLGIVKQSDCEPSATPLLTFGDFRSATPYRGLFRFQPFYDPLHLISGNSGENSILRDLDFRVVSYLSCRL